MLDIVEMVLTLSGEAPNPGAPVFLVRFSGCNLDCLYCDTPHKDEKNLSLSREELINRIRQETRAYPGLSLLFTGGEPLLGDRQDILLSMIAEFPATQFFIETNGSVKIRDFSLPNCHFVVDWKTASSGCGASFCFDNLGHLHPRRDCIKLVINREDLSSVLEIISTIRAENHLLPVYLSPQHNALDLRETAEFILEHKLPASLSLQLHKLIWQEKVRGV